MGKLPNSISFNVLRRRFHQNFLRPLIFSKSTGMIPLQSLQIHSNPLLADTHPTPSYLFRPSLDRIWKSENPFLFFFQPLDNVLQCTRHVWNYACSPHTRYTCFVIRHPKSCPKMFIPEASKNRTLPNLAKSSN